MSIRLSFQQISQKKTRKTIEKELEILPLDFANRIRMQFPTDYEQFIAAINQAPATSLRVNPRKFTIQAATERVPWCKSGTFLPQRPLFVLDPIFHAGGYYVQEASSMFLEQVFAQIEQCDNQLVLDLCAAPGGKSTHLLSLIQPNGLLVANEAIRSRVTALHENIKKWGHQNVVITNSDPTDFGQLQGLFDVVVVDAPCSGEGLFRRDISAAEQWSIHNADLCAARQRRIVADVWPALKTGGYLIYSTCTFNPDENEENLKWLAENHRAEGIRIPINTEWGIDEIETKGIFGYRFLPHKTKGEGFFMAIVRKTEEEGSLSFSKKTKTKQEKIPGQFNEAKNWIESSGFLVKNDYLIAFPETKAQVIDVLAGNTRIVNFGLPIAQFKKNGLLPEHTLALSVDRKPDVFETIELSLNDALLFLKKEEIRIGATGKGWLLAQYQGVPLGFVKNLGNRANNYYPKEWRIRMSLPSELPLPWHSEKR